MRNVPRRHDFLESVLAIPSDGLTQGTRGIRLIDRADVEAVCHAHTEAKAVAKLAAIVRDELGEQSRQRILSSSRLPRISSAIIYLRLTALPLPGCESRTAELHTAVPMTRILRAGGTPLRR